MSGFTIFLLVCGIIFSIGGLFFLIAGIITSEPLSSELNVLSGIGIVVTAFAIFAFIWLGYEVKQPHDLQKQYIIRQTKINKAKQELQIWLIRHPNFKIEEIKENDIRR
ncbi:MAG: hypothetical protein IIT65_00220 [Lachnospiraceae bacterium]|nr:hypothetical protein [Lachnospiraceae bacterium]